MNSHERKTQAFIKFLRSIDEEVPAPLDFKYGCFIAEDGAEYRVLTDDEAERETIAAIEDSLWAFRPSFLASHAGVDEVVFEALADKLGESASVAIKRLLPDWDHFVQDAIKADGRGHFLAHYDNEENEVKLDGEFFFIYRVN